MFDSELAGLLGELGETVKEELASNPEVVDKTSGFKIEDLPIEARRWYKLDDVVAVVADLKNSTQLGTGKYAASTASIYEASTGGVVKIFSRFKADFVAIQGDGAFALFWGEGRYERALCAGITVKTFSLDLTDQLERRWPTSLPETGLKVGIANGRVLAKRVGAPRNPAQQEPVWAGKAVNYATKAAQSAERHQLIVTGGVWDWVKGNDYLSMSCSCGEPSPDIWEDIEIGKLPEGDAESQGRLLNSIWCETHGEEYCGAVLAGESHREDAVELRKQVQLSQMRTAVSRKAKAENHNKWARTKGLNS